MKNRNKLMTHMYQHTLNISYSKGTNICYFSADLAHLAGIKNVKVIILLTAVDTFKNFWILLQKALVHVNISSFKVHAHLSNDVSYHTSIGDCNVSSMKRSSNTS